MKRDKFVSLYSDEMHIQQDWNYFNHNDDGQFAVRYYTPSMAKYIMINTKNH
jgi:hypothetical protein